jgi:hypothetical protein
MCPATPLTVSETLPGRGRRDSPLAMAADLPETDLAHLRRWCGQRIPAHAQHQVRLEHQTHGRAVTITERRAPWHPDYGPEWTTRPVAQLRHSTHGWRLIHDMPTTENVAPLLEVIDDPDQPPASDKTAPTPTP